VFDTTLFLFILAAMHRSALPLLILLMPFVGRCQDSAPYRRDTTRNSQDTRNSREATRIGGSLYLRIGAQFADYSGLNSRLKATGYSYLRSASPEFGFGFGLRRKAIGLMADLSFITAKQVSFTDYGVTFGLLFYTDKIATDDLIFSPHLGIASQFLTFDLTQNSTATSFNAALTTAPNRVQLYYNNASLDMGLTLKFHNAMTRHHRLHDLPILRVGYRYGLAEYTWNVRGASDLPGAPRDRASNFYIALMLGTSH
jgi:hypothetical protein